VDPVTNNDVSSDRYFVSVDCCRRAEDSRTGSWAIVGSDRAGPRTPRGYPRTLRSRARTRPGDTQYDRPGYDNRGYHENRPRNLRGSEPHPAASRSTRPVPRIIPAQRRWSEPIRNRLQSPVHPSKPTSLRHNQAENSVFWAIHDHLCCIIPMDDYSIVPLPKMELTVCCTLFLLSFCLGVSIDAAR
jgi:hypothetical protein